MQIDFTVPVIDNFGDMGFALSLALSMTERDPTCVVHFYSEDRGLFEKMLGGDQSERIAYRELTEWKDSIGSEVRFNFFGYALRDEDLREAKNLKKILNFDYLQFHRGGGPGNPGIVSLHGTKYEIGNKDITYLVPSPLPEWAGIVVPPKPNEQELNAVSQLLEDAGKARKLCSVFVYPPTVKAIEAFASRHPDWTFLVCGWTAIPGKNIVPVPFLPVLAYYELLKRCDANIVRGENSLMAAALAGKPFLWDIYRESNGAHEEKMRDFGSFVEPYVSWRKTLLDFMGEDGKTAALDSLLMAHSEDFSELESDLEKHDIVKSIEKYL